jgi:hypothetical protein
LLSAINYQGYRSIARLHDHNLIARDEEPVLSQLRQSIEKEGRKLVHLYVTWDLCSQSQAQPKAGVWEIRRNAVAHQSDLTFAEPQLCYLRPSTAAPVSLVNHVHNDVTLPIDDADFVVNDEVAVIAVVREECEHRCGDSEQTNVPRYTPAHMMIELHLRNAGAIKVERAVQAFPVLRPELRTSLLDFGMAFRNTLLQATPARIATLSALYCFLAGAQALPIAFRLFVLAQLTLGALLAVPINPSRLGMPRALAALRGSLYSPATLLIRSGCLRGPWSLELTAASHPTTAWGVHGAAPWRTPSTAAVVALSLS